MIIDFSGNGGGSGSGGSVVEVTQVLSAGTKIATISVDETPTDLYAPSAATVDLSDYYTSAETQDYVTGKGYQTSGNVETLIAGATSAFTTSASVATQINAATSAFTTSADFKTINSQSIIGSGNIDIQGGELNNYVNQDLGNAYGFNLENEDGNIRTYDDVPFGTVEYNLNREVWADSEGKQSFKWTDDEDITDGDVIFMVNAFNEDEGDNVTVGSLYFINDNGDISFGFSAETEDYDWITSGTWNPRGDDPMQTQWFIGNTPKSQFSAYWTDVLAVKYEDDYDGEGTHRISMFVSRYMNENAEWTVDADALGYGEYENEDFAFSMPPAMWMVVPDYKADGTTDYDFESGDRKVVPFNPVNSTDIRNIVKLTQAEYDELVNNDQVDPMTLYLIEEE